MRYELRRKNGATVVHGGGKVMDAFEAIQRAGREAQVAAVTGEVDKRVAELEARIARLEADLNHQTALARRWEEKWTRCHALAWSLQKALRVRIRKGHLEGILTDQERGLYREEFPGHGE